MSDIGDIESASSVKIIGSNPDGTETSPVGASSNQELFIRDTNDNGGLDKVIDLTTAPVEGKVGLFPKSLRKAVIMQALSNNVKFGFSSSSQSFDLFKNQLLIIPVGENTEVWFKVSVGTGQVSFGELS